MRISNRRRKRVTLAVTVILGSAVLTGGVGVGLAHACEDVPGAVRCPTIPGEWREVRLVIDKPDPQEIRAGQRLNLQLRLSNPDGLRLQHHMAVTPYSDDGKPSFAIDETGAITGTHTVPGEYDVRIDTEYLNFEGNDKVIRTTFRVKVVGSDQRPGEDTSPGSRPPTPPTDPGNPPGSRVNPTRVTVEKPGLQEIRTGQRLNLQLRISKPRDLRLQHSMILTPYSDGKPSFAIDETGAITGTHTVPGEYDIVVATSYTSEGKDKSVYTTFQVKVT